MFSKDYTLKKFKELPAYLQSNIYILTGYRVHLKWKQALKSVFHLHNETANIWTHIIGLFITCYYLYNGYFHVIPNIYLKRPELSFMNQFMDYAVFFVYSTCLLLQMIFSVCFHSIGCVNQNIHRTCMELDYTGIVISIGGSFITCCFYIFYCFPNLKIGYISSMVVLTSISVWFVVSPKFKNPQYQSLRGMTFLSLGWFAFFPLFHSAYIHETELISLAIGKMLKLAFYYSIGAIFYILKFPEKYSSPGKFDLVKEKNMEKKL